MIRSGLERGRRNLGSQWNFYSNFALFFFFGKGQVILPPAVFEAAQPKYVLSVFLIRECEQKMDKIIAAA